MSIDEPAGEDFCAVGGTMSKKPTIIKISVKPHAKPRTSEVGKNVTVVKLNGTPPDSCGEDDADDFRSPNPKRRAFDDKPKTPIAPSCQAVKHAVSDLYRIDDFNMDKIGVGFFSDVYKATHKTTKKVMVLKLNKHKTNKNNMLKEVQLMNRLNHPNILRLEAACVNNGQLHALTEFIDGGDLEQLIQKNEDELPWSLKLSLALDVAKGLAYLHSRGMFHRDLTSKNILIRKGAILSAVIGDFGLATNIPKEESGDSVRRLPQVGSPYWMSPECLKGEFYNEKSDVFSLGIVLCEIIARTSADPDVLPRTENFGVDYIAFSKLCLDCPPDFLKVAFSCVRIDPQSRPSASDLSKELEDLLVSYKIVKEGAKKSKTVYLSLKQEVDHKKSDVIPHSTKKQSSGKLFHSPSEKARFHYNTLSIGKEMSIGDPHYRPTEDNKNPFLALSIQEGEVKILANCPRDKSLLFSSCFEIRSPERSNNTGTSGEAESKSQNSSLPSSPRLSKNWRRDGKKKEAIPTSMSENVNLANQANENGSLISRYFEDQMFQGRVQLLRDLYSGGCLVTKDDSALDLYSSANSSSSYSSGSTYGWSNGSSEAEHYRSAMVRRSSCESGFYSSYAGNGRSPLFKGKDNSWCFSEHAGQGFEYEDSLLSFSNSAKSIGSSLLTVSDLEEDLRAASLFLSSKRTSSVFTDSMDDLSSITDQDFDLEQQSSTSGKSASASGGSSFLSASSRRKGRNHYEKDIRDIVEYFETSCNVSSTNQTLELPLDNSSRRRRSPTGPASLQRSQKIENLIKRVVEKESRERFRKAFLATGAGVTPATGIGISKIFQQQQRLQVCNGIVRSKLPIFDASMHGGLQRSRLGEYQKPGHVKARKAFFDQGGGAKSSLSEATSDSAKRLAEKRLQALAQASSSMNHHKKSET